MLRSVAVAGLELLQASEFLRGPARQPDEVSRNNLLVLPATLAQVEVTESRHGQDVGVEPGAKLPPFHAVDLWRAIPVVAPPDIRWLDPNRFEDALEHHVVQVAAVREGEAFGEPVGTGIAVMPFGAGREEQLPVAARLLETSRLIRQVTQRDARQPAGCLVGLRRNPERRLKTNRRVIELHLAILQREPEGGDANRLGGGFQVVELPRVAPLQHEPALANDDP